MKILITGSKGFVGKNLKDTLSLNKEISILENTRDDDETKAWGYLQAIGFNNAKASRQLSQAETIEDFNWPDVGITT